MDKNNIEHTNLLALKLLGHEFSRIQIFDPNKAQCTRYELELDQGVRLNKLRTGPFDKQGTGSRILDARARVRLAELDRLRDFASTKTTPGGGRELGLDAAELEAMMDANAARAGDRLRLVDRQLMSGEWPPLLEVMGKEGANGRYLSLREVRALFVERRLPARMLKRLG